MPKSWWSESAVHATSDLSVWQEWGESKWNDREAPPQGLIDAVLAHLAKVGVPVGKTAGDTSQMRAVITFMDRAGSAHIYLPIKGSPTTVHQALEGSVAYASPLPKFEPGEIATAYARVAKDGPDGMRMLPTGLWTTVSPPDARYRYVVSIAEGAHYVEAYAVHWDHDTGRWYETALFAGTVDMFGQWAANDAKGV